MRFTRSLLLAVILLVSYSVLNAQTLTWTGTQNNDFFNEANWVETDTESPPADGSLEPGSAIAFRLQVSDASLDIAGEGKLVFTSTNLGVSLVNASLSCDGLETGQVSVSDHATLILTDEAPLGEAGSVDIADNTGWLKLTQVNPYVADSVYLDQIRSAGAATVLDENIRINQYYFKGSLVRVLDTNYRPLTLFDGTGQSGGSLGIPESIIYSRDELAEFDNVTSSFRLERGYMVNMAIFQNGKGKSQVYIASEEAITIDLQQALDNNVSYVRVIPWNWVTKKGVSGFKEGMNASWTYNWNNKNESLPNMEYAPMSWGGGGATSGAVAEYIQKEKITHLMGFNESDNCNGQSGQYGGLCEIDIAVPTFSNLMSSGLRLVSPSPRENGPFTWLEDFTDEAQKQDVRYDVMGVHWYDWGSGPANTPFEDPEMVFNRFKNYLDRVYTKYGLPIWITEFNANANRDLSVQHGFLELALPYLESLDYIERYDYFVPNPEVAGDRDDIEYAMFFDEQGNITPFGELFRDFESTPAIPEASWTTPTYLAEMDQRIEVDFEVTEDSVTEGESMLITVTTSRPVGAPQELRISIQNLSEEAYSFTEEVLAIPEGGKSAETIMILNDNDEVEANQEISVGLSGLTDGLQWSGAEQSFVLVNDDEEEETVVLGSAGFNQLSVWPNPAVNTVHIDHLPKGLISIQCTAMDGKTYDLKLSSADEANISHLSPGIYVLSLISADEKIESTRKLIVK